MKNLNLKNSKPLALAAVAAVCLASFTARAQAAEPAQDVPTHTVRYADLNLDTQAGAAALYQRIRYAAKEVCGDSGVRELARVAAAKACVDRAVLWSVRAVNKPMLTAEYDTQVGAGQKPINLAAVN